MSLMGVEFTSVPRRRLSAKEQCYIEILFSYILYSTMHYNIELKTVVDVFFNPSVYKHYLAERLTFLLVLYQDSVNLAENFKGQAEFTILRFQISLL